MKSSLTSDRRKQGNERLKTSETGSWWRKRRRMQRREGALDRFSQARQLQVGGILARKSLHLRLDV